MQWFIADSTLDVQGPAESDYEDRMPIGYPIAGNELTVSDENGAPSREGEVGELLVRSPYVALGTWTSGHHEATNIHTDPHDQNVRILHTGDLVRRRSDGLYDRIGRKDRQVKIRGTRVELDGVEAAIRRHDCVRDVAVLARLEGAMNAIRLVAYVQLDDSSGRGLSAVEAMMRRIVPSHMQPWRYYATPTIPRLPSSKLDSGALRAMDIAKREEESEICVDMHDAEGIERDPIIALAARIWRRVLEIERVAAEDDFFSLGGDSLGALTMTVELEQALGRELPINLINQAPTFGAFCARLQTSERAVYSPLVELKPGHRLPAVFFIHGLGGSVMELFALARKMNWSGPVIGIQARGLDRRDVPHRSVVEMADEYLRAVKARQPQGPYLLCGYSFGGLVAFELARRLSDSGDEVAFVGLIDTLPPKHHVLRLWKWAGYLYRRLARGGKARSRGVELRALRASVTYRPDPYCGELTFLEPTRRDLGVPSAAKHWAHFARSLQRHTLAGRHDDMLSGSNASGAAAVLTQCLEAAHEAWSLRALPGRMSVPDRANTSVPVNEISYRGGATTTTSVGAR
jgi:thioesterase domain-containing protein/acyl carrier protein